MTTADTPRHVVLARPGDVLLIGNIGHLPPDQLSVLGEAFRHLGIEVLVFAADIDIARAAPGQGTGPT